MELREVIEGLERMKNNSGSLKNVDIFDAALALLKQSQGKVVDIEDCIILGYSWSDLKKAVDFAKSKGFEPKPPEKVDVPELPSPLVLTNPFRSFPPDNLEQVHYALGKLADKIDEMIYTINALIKWANSREGR